jgi:hypothetical protein
VNGKILFTVILSAVLCLSLFIGIVASNKLQNPIYVSYRFDAVLSNPVVTTTVTPPIVHMQGYRPQSGVQSCNVTINGIQYTYPKDFSYNETFTVDANQATNKSIFVVITTLTFNIQGNPTITEWMTSQVTRNGNITTTDDGTFFLTGTGIFSNIGGGGFVESTGDTGAGTDYAHHIGLIKDWPL